MKKNILCMFLIIFFITGCQTDEEISPVVGEWLYTNNVEYKYIFNSNGTGSYNGNIFTYTDENGNITLTFTGSLKPIKLKYEIVKDELVLTDSNKKEFRYVNKKDYKGPKEIVLEKSDEDDE